MPVAGGRLLRLLDGTGCSAAEVGGKGAGLDRLASHGFPIPRSYALSADAYRLAVAEADLEGWLAEVSARPLPPPGLLASEEAEISDRFAAIVLPDRVAAAIDEATIDLQRKGRVAIRSSATAEDQREASFAGQYRSYTRVEGADAVATAVKRCWASLWAPSAREYRRRHRIGQRDLAMAVVIQTMIEADWSGVAFTRDPAGRSDRMRIEVVPGLGEALVSGAVTPLDFTVDRTTLAVATRRGGEPPGFLESLARMLLRVEDELDAPQDVEWSWTPNGIVLLQTRPVTVGGPTAALDDGFDRPVDTGDTFTPHGVVEMLPGVVTPLLWTINAPMVESGFRNVIDELGGPVTADRQPFVGRFRGRAALNLTALQAVAAGTPGGSAAAVEEQFLGYALSPAEERRRRVGRRPLRRARRARSLLVDEVALVCGAADAVVGLDVDLEELPARRLLAYGHQVRDLAWRITAAEVASSSAAAAAYQALQWLLARWVDPQDAARWAQQLTAGGLQGEVAGTRLVRLLGDIWRTDVAPHPDLAMAVAGLPAERIEASVARLGERGTRLVAAINAASRLAGSMAVYGGRCWEEDPASVWRQLAESASVRPLPPVERRRAGPVLLPDLAAGRRWRVMRILTGQIVDLRMRWIQHQATEAVSWLRRREQAKTALLTLGGEERRIIAECARRLVASSHLADPDDIELHSDLEVQAMLLGAAPPAPSVLLWRRRVSRRSRVAPALPEVFTGSPEHAPLSATAATDTLSGWAASPGRAAGRARVVGSLAAAGELQTGDVLVAQATDPSWTPVLARVTALVLETGGPLSHGAIVARELGIPAVLCVPQATVCIADGETVEVDGYSGIVRRSAGAIEEAV